MYLVYYISTEVNMKEFKCETNSHGNFLYGKKQSVISFLFRLYSIVSFNEEISR